MSSWSLNLSLVKTTCKQEEELLDEMKMCMKCDLQSSAPHVGFRYEGPAYKQDSRMPYKGSYTCQRTPTAVKVITR